MKTSHTQGPWKCNQNHDLQYQIHNDQFVIAHIQVYPDNIGELKPNALLIAAAPELLEAAAAVMAWFDAGRLTEPNFVSLRNLSSAISKAKGAPLKQY